MALTDAQKAHVQSLINKFLKDTEEPAFQSQYTAAVGNVSIAAAADLAKLEQVILEDGIDSVNDIQKQTLGMESEGHRQGALAAIRKKLFG